MVPTPNIDSIKIFTTKSNKHTLATGFPITVHNFSSLGKIFGSNVVFVSAKYIQIGCMLSAGANVIYNEGAPQCAISDHISFLMYCLLVIDPSTCPDI